MASPVAVGGVAGCCGRSALMSAPVGMEAWAALSDIILYSAPSLPAAPQSIEDGVAHLLRQRVDLLHRRSLDELLLLVHFHGRHTDRRRGRSDTRRVGNACVSTCRSRWTSHNKTNNI